MLFGFCGFYGGEARSLLCKSQVQKRGPVVRTPNLRCEITLPKRVRHNTIARSVGEAFEFAIEIEGTNVGSGKAELKFDEKVLDLIRGKETVPLPAGDFHQTVSWKLRGVEEAEATWINAFMVAGDLAQAATIRVRVTRLKRVR